MEGVEVTMSSPTKRFFQAYLAAIHVFDGALSEKKIHVRVRLERAHKLRIVQPFVVELSRP